MTSTGYADLAVRVRAAPAQCGSTRVIAVDGRAGSGKTTVADRLAAALGDAPVVHMDDLYPGWDGLADGVAMLVRHVLEPLAAGRRATYPRWDWHHSTWGGRVDVPEADVLLVEGCGSGSRAAARYLSLLVWVHAPEPVRKARALARDGELFRPHWERWARQEDALFSVERTRERADVAVDGTDVGT